MALDIRQITGEMQFAVLAIADRGFSHARRVFARSLSVGLPSLNNSNHLEDDLPLFESSLDEDCQQLRRLESEVYAQLDQLETEDSTLRVWVP